MSDLVIGPIIRVIDTYNFQMQVTHIGRNNQKPYKTYETIYVASNNTGRALTPSTRVTCSVRYRDAFNRLYADVYLET